MNLCVVAAMSKEKDLLVGAGIENVVVSGIGKANAAACATEVILKTHPDAIINSGVAGSFNPSVHVGDIVVGTQTAYHDVWCGADVPMGCVQGEPARFDADSHLISAARSIAAPSGIQVHFGLIASGDQFYLNESEDRRIATLYPDALACDMESAAIAQVCRRFGIPFLSIRLVSDVHTNATVQKQTYEAFWQSAPEASAAFTLALARFIENKY